MALRSALGDNSCHAVCEGLGLRNGFLVGGNDLHLPPIVGEFFATIEADNVSPSKRAGGRAAALTAHRERNVFMGTAEERVQQVM